MFFFYSSWTAHSYSINSDCTIERSAVSYYNNIECIVFIENLCPSRTLLAKFTLKTTFVCPHIYSIFRLTLTKNRRWKMTDCSRYKNVDSYI
jgi:hypothetical protein